MRLRLIVPASLLAASVSFSPAAHAQVCRPMPEAALAESLLASLPPAVQLERRDAVRSNVALCPGVVENFLASLMNWEYLAARNANPNGLADAYAPEGVNVFPGRSMAYRLAPPQTLHVGGADYRVRDGLVVSPLVADVNQDGVLDVNGGHWEPHTGLNLAGPVALFDIDGDGYRDLTEWVGPSDALLVAPADLSKVVTTPTGVAWVGPVSGRDLLGTAGGYLDGFHRLVARFDANHDGILRDAELNGLYLWQDTDADAAIDPGEFRTLDASELDPPLPGGCVGAFYYPDLNGATVYDWWPSFFTVDPVTAGSTSPATLPLDATPLADHSYSSLPLGLDVDDMIRTDYLDWAGMNVPSARLLAVSPDGARVVVADRATDPAELAAGRARRLWVFGGPFFTGTLVTSRVVPLPATDVVQIVFDGPSRALLVVDGGSRLLRMEATTGALEELSVPAVAGAKFRYSSFARRAGSGVFVSGSFIDALGNAGPEVLARVEDSAGSLHLITDLDLDAARAAASAYGSIVCELPDSPQRQYFVTRETGAGSSGGTLVAVGPGGTTVVDHGVTLGGLAASGNRLLYFREIPGSTDVDALVRDFASGRTFHLGAGPYSYPYLADGGKRAVLQAVDWPGEAMVVSVATVTDGATFSFVLGTAFGATRVADDGATLASLTQYGLFITPRVATAVPEPVAGEAASFTVAPNPFSARTTLRLALPQARRVQVDVLSIDGRRVARLLDDVRPAGANELVWRGVDRNGRALPAGAYRIRVDDGTRRSERRVALVR